MIAIAAAAFVGTTPALSLWPAGGVTSAPALMQPKPVPTSVERVGECGGISPKDLDCYRSIAAAACLGKVCWPNVKASPGYTGSITARLEGRQRAHADAPWETVYVAYSCGSYTVGTQTTAGSVARWTCSADSSPGCEVECNMAPLENGAFRLVGYATPPPSSRLLGAGQWTAFAETPSG